MTYAQSISLHFALALALLASTRFLFADTVQVMNSINAHSSTGGNSVTSGSVVEGNTSNSVLVHIEVNGQTVEEYYAQGTDPIHYSNSVSTSSVLSKTHVSVGADTGTSSVRTGVSTLFGANTSSHTSASTSAVTSASASTTSSGDALRNFISRLLAQLQAFIYAWFQ